MLGILLVTRGTTAEEPVALPGVAASEPEAARVA
jgi:hypothetical protein